MAVVRGVEACRGGWLCAEQNLGTGGIAARMYLTAVDLFDDTSAVMTAIDIPIGLPRAGSRSCDEEARRLLGEQASSLIPAPVRSALGHQSYEAACVAAQASGGGRLSKQTFAILPRIREVDEILTRVPELRRTAREAHPEVCFYFLNGERPLIYSTRTELGFAERLELLRPVFGAAADHIRRAIPPRDADDAEVVDALAALWTARRIYIGQAKRLPKTDDRDEVGLPMEMLA
jgi:predicted RNase H-like nuclease